MKPRLRWNGLNWSCEGYAGLAPADAYSHWWIMTTPLPLGGEKFMHRWTAH